MLTQIQDFLKIMYICICTQNSDQIYMDKKYIAFNYFLHSKHNNIQYLIKQTDIQNSSHWLKGQQGIHSKAVRKNFIINNASSNYTHWNLF